MTSFGNQYYMGLLWAQCHGPFQSQNSYIFINTYTLHTRVYTCISTRTYTNFPTVSEKLTSLFLIHTVLKKQASMLFHAQKKNMLYMFFTLSKCLVFFRLSLSLDFFHFISFSFCNIYHSLKSSLFSITKFLWGCGTSSISTFLLRLVVTWFQNKSIFT